MKNLEYISICFLLLLSVVIDTSGQTNKPGQQKKLIPEATFETLGQVGIDENWVREKTGNNNMDGQVEGWVRDICLGQGLKANHFFLNSGSELDRNAYVFTKWADQLDEAPDGTIVIGIQLLNDNSAVSFVNYALVAHEIWHLVQHRERSELRGVDRELDADKGAGRLLARYLLGKKFDLPDVNIFVGSVSKLFYEKGSNSYNDPDFHGTPQERAINFFMGANEEIKRSSKPLNIQATENEFDMDKFWMGASPKLRHPAGTKAGEGWVITAQDGSGFMSYGPYISLPEGKYEAEFHFSHIEPVNPADTLQSYLQLDSSTWNQKANRSEFRVQKYIFAQDLLPPEEGKRLQKQSYKLLFDVTPETASFQWEFRVFTWAKVNFGLERITLKKL